MASMTSGSLPSLIAIPWLLPLAVIAVATSYTLYQRFFHPFASIPGPFWASLTRLWMTKHSWDGDMNTVMMALHAKHGPLVRVAPWEVSVADPNAIKKIYGAGTKFRKSDWVCMLWHPFSFPILKPVDLTSRSTQYGKAIASLISSPSVMRGYMASRDGS